MSAPVTSEVSNVVGSIEMNHITAKGENHYCCRWKIDDILSYDLSNGEFKSPVFTIPNRNTCKWYLRFQSSTTYLRIAPNQQVLTLSIRLVLDDESDCKKAMAKIKLSVDRADKRHEDECNLQSSRISKFVPKLENRTGIVLIFPIFGLFLTIVCDMTIETVAAKDESFPADFGYLLKNQLFSDVALSVGKKKYPAHKMILATRSSVFAAMFAHDLTENRQGVVNIKDTRKEVVEAMLHYIYTGEVEKLNDLAQDLLIAADKYDLKGLKCKCEEVLTDSLSSSNAFDLLLLAQSYNASELKFEAINFITIRSTHLMKTSAWDRLFQSNPELARELCETVFHPKFTATETKVE